MVLLLGTIFTGCQDLLNKNPSDQPSSIEFYSNEEELEMAVNGIYTVLWNFESRNLPIGAELDNTTDIGFHRSGHVKTIAQGGHSSTNAIIAASWDRLYAGIGKVNTLLDNMTKAEENVSEEFYARIQAEARFLRAFCYFYLTELWGDVPLLVTTPSLDEAEMGRTPKSDVVEQIIADLDFAADNLPVSWSGNNEGRATQGAAYALKSRVALYNERYSVAASTAQQVMNLNEYSLYPDYEELFQYEGEGNAEAIFTVPYQRGVHDHNIPFRMGTRNTGGVSTDVPSQFMIDSYIATDGLPIDESSVYDPTNPFENRDPRMDASIVRPQGTFGGYVFETHPDSSETWFIDGDDSTRVQNEDVTNPFATFTGYTWRKYTDPEDLPTYRTESSLDWMYIRFGEVLLNYAEAKIENGDIDQSVLVAMNQVRARGFGVDPSQTGQYPAITTTNQSELRRIVRNERKVELALEGLRLFDIRRWGIAEEVKDGPLVGRPQGVYSTIPSPPNIDDETGHPDYGSTLDLYRTPEPRTFNPDRHWLWPIPQHELDANDNMTQNPGY
jgi:hypothetical protein